MNKLGFKELSILPLATKLQAETQNLNGEDVILTLAIQLLNRFLLRHHNFLSISLGSGVARIVSFYTIPPCTHWEQEPEHVRIHLPDGIYKVSQETGHRYT
jgi:hypothetical protein